MCEAVLKHTTPSSEEKLECELQCLHNLRLLQQISVSCFDSHCGVQDVLARRRAPNISIRFLEHATSMYGMFNGDSEKGRPVIVTSAASSSHHVDGGDSD